MGDRTEFGFRESAESPTLFLYGHWAGREMFARLAKALNRVIVANRLDDPRYATRICISDMVDDHDSNLGWGLAIDKIAADVEHKVPIVDWDTGTVTLYDPFSYDENENPMPVTIVTTWDIPRFVEKFSKLHKEVNSAVYIDRTMRI